MRRATSLGRVHRRRFAKWKINAIKSHTTTAKGVTDDISSAPASVAIANLHEKKNSRESKSAGKKPRKKGDGIPPSPIESPIKGEKEAGRRGTDILMLAYSPRRLSDIRWVGVCINLGIRVCRQVRCDLQEPGLDQEVPHATGLVDVYLHQVSSFSSAKLSTSPGVLSHEGFLDYKIRFRQDTQRRA